MSILSAAERSAQLAGEDPAALTDEVDPEEMAQSAPVEPVHPVHPERHELQAAGRPATPVPSRPEAHSSTELLESHQGRTADAPLCLICGTKMRPAGSCYVCEGCGSTSGCS